MSAGPRLAVALALAATPAAAAPCPGTGAGGLVTQADLNGCALAAWKAADAAMNAAYERVIVRLDPGARDTLREAQRAWIPFRDASCAFEALGVEGGSAQPMVRGGCLAAATRARTQTLNGYLNCAEGDLACPPLKR